MGSNIRTYIKYFILLFICTSVQSQVQNTNERVRIQECIESDADQPIRHWTVPPEFMTNNQSITFSLEKKALNCPKEQVQTVDIHGVKSWVPLDIDGQFLPSGHLKLAEDSYHPSEYCIKRISPGSIEVQLCPSNDCQNNDLVCIRKCCPHDKVYRFHTERELKGCMTPLTNMDNSSSLGPWSPTLYRDLNKKLTPEQSSKIKLHFLEAKPMGPRFLCETGLHLLVYNPKVSQEIEKKLGVSLDSVRYVILENGQVLLQQSNGKCAQIAQNQFCVDSIYDYGTGESFRNSEDEGMLFSCSPLETEAMTIGKAYGIIMFCASIFLLLTIIVYIILWEKQTIHGWCIMSYSGTMFFFYIVQGIIHFLREQSYLDTVGCKAIGILGHFLIFSVFSWLTVICFDLWWTFKTLRPTSKTSKGLKRYILYGLCAWGIPLIIILISVVIDQTLGKITVGVCLTWTTPGYGRESCSIDRESQGLYLYYPAAFLLLINFIFFAITLMKLLEYQKASRFAHQNTNENRGMFRVFTKLFFVMGLTWIFEIISWAVTNGRNNSVWIVFDIINILQAFAIFVIFVCKEDILMSLEEKHPFFKGLFNPLRKLVIKRETKENVSSTGGNSKTTKESDMDKTLPGETLELKAGHKLDSDTDG